MRLALVAMAIGGLCACQRSAADELVFEAARTHAEMPDCASLHVNWAWQRKEGDHYLLAAQFVATESCMELWERNLANSKFVSQSPHGEWVKSDDPVTLVSVPFDGTRRGAIFPISKPIRGIEIVEPVESL